jgi:DnaJ-class molecular chaperone
MVIWYILWSFGIFFPFFSQKSGKPGFNSYRFFAGSTYRNLNPYEVLQISPDAALDEVKKKYRRLSILVHPDKNQVPGRGFESRQEPMLRS